MGRTTRGVSDEKRVRFKIEPGEVVLEIFSIVVAILLALAVNSWQQRLHDERTLRASLANIANEMQINQRFVDHYRPHHLAVYRAFGALLSRRSQDRVVSFGEFIGLVERSSPRGIGGVSLQDIAWRIAQTDQGLSLMFYRERTQVAEIYEIQSARRGALERYVQILSAPTLQPKDNFYFVALATYLALGDLVSAEDELGSQYTRELAALRSGKTE